MTRLLLAYAHAPPAHMKNYIPELAADTLDVVLG